MSQSNSVQTIIDNFKHGVDILTMFNKMSDDALRTMVFNILQKSGPAHKMTPDSYFKEATVTRIIRDSEIASIEIQYYDKVVLLPGVIRFIDEHGYHPQDLMKFDITTDIDKLKKELMK
jgi:hypothetical protein